MSMDLRNPGGGRGSLHPAVRRFGNTQTRPIHPENPRPGTSPWCVRACDLCGEQFTGGSNYLVFRVAAYHGKTNHLDVVERLALELKS